MNDVAKNMAPKKRVNMALMQAVTIVTTATTVLITVATTMETITVITSTDILVTSTVAIIDLWEYKHMLNKYLWNNCIVGVSVKHSHD